MTETPPAVAPRPSPAGRPFPTAALWLFFGTPLMAVVVLCALRAGGPFQRLLFGWLTFPLKRLPRMTADGPTALLGLVCTGLFVAGLHATIRWGLRHYAPESGARWSFRSTAAAAAVLVLMFAAGTAMVGATHQLVWLATGRAAKPPSPDEPSDDYRPFIWGFERTFVNYQLRSHGLELHNLAGVHGFLPPGGTVDETGTLLHGWAIFLGGYANYTYDGVDFSRPWNVPPNDRIFRCGLKEFINPGQPGPRFDAAGYGLSHFAANVHVFPFVTVGPGSSTWDWASPVKKAGGATRMKDMTDGTSNTILLGTVATRPKPWGHPANVRDPALGMSRDPEGFGGPEHWGGGLLLMADGTVKVISRETDPRVLYDLGTPAGGEGTTAESLAP